MVPRPPRPWEIEEEPEPRAKHRAAEPEAPEEPEGKDEREPERAPSLRVVAEPEDDLPEIEWKLPSISLLDTVTARRERMADEIKRNVRVIETTLGTYAVSGQPAYGGHPKGPVAAAAQATTLALPLYVDLGEEDVRDVVLALRQLLA